MHIRKQCLELSANESIVSYSKVVNRLSVSNNDHMYRFYCHPPSFCEDEGSGLSVVRKIIRIVFTDLFVA